MCHFYKYQALGNDYIIIDPNKINFNLALSTKNISLICERNFGIGSNGILYGPIINKDKKLKFRIFNPDGSEAEKSGNGLRIFALYVMDQKYVKGNKFDLFLQNNEKINAEYLGTKDNIIKVNLGKYSFLKEPISSNITKTEILNKQLDILGTKYYINYVNIGNPHCVIFKKNIKKTDALTLGPEIEHHAFFPQKTNVQIAEILDDTNIKIEIWERGVGYSLSSGTSSAAVACIAHKLGIAKNKVTIHMPEGIVKIELLDNYAYLEGEVARIIKGNFTDDFIKKLIA